MPSRFITNLQNRSRSTWGFVRNPKAAITTAITAKRNARIERATQKYFSAARELGIEETRAREIAQRMATNPHAVDANVRKALHRILSAGKKHANKTARAQKRVDQASRRVTKLRDPASRQNLKITIRQIKTKRPLAEAQRELAAVGNAPKWKEYLRHPKKSNQKRIKVNEAKAKVAGVEKKRQNIVDSTIGVAETRLQTAQSRANKITDKANERRDIRIARAKNKYARTQRTE